MNRNTSLLAMSLLLALAACDDSTSSTPSPKPAPTVGFGTEILGAWAGDSTVSVTAAGMTVTPTIHITNTLLADSTFSGDLQLLNVLSGNNVTGALYTRSGTWTILGDSAIVLAATTCSQSDTMTVLGVGALPFSFPGLVANARKAVSCGTADTVKTHPAGNTWAIPLKVNLPGIAVGTWTLNFKR